MLFPKFCHNANHELDNIQNAPFYILQELHALEFLSTFKYCYKLTSKALSLSYLERQNVNILLQIFNEHTVQGLLT